jgi:hypothetical protein
MLNVKTAPGAVLEQQASTGSAEVRLITIFSITTWTVYDGISPA